MTEQATLADLEHLLERGVEIFFLEGDDPDKSKRRLLAAPELFAVTQLYWRHVYDLLKEQKHQVAREVLEEVSKFIEAADEMDRLLQEGPKEFPGAHPEESESTVSIIVPVLMHQLESHTAQPSRSAEATYLLMLQQQLMFPLTQSQDY
jgi:hypothetical protein